MMLQKDFSFKNIIVHFQDRMDEDSDEFYEKFEGYKIPKRKKSEKVETIKDVVEKFNEEASKNFKQEKTSPIKPRKLSKRSARWMDDDEDDNPNNIPIGNPRNNPRDNPRDNPKSYKWTGGHRSNHQESQDFEKSDITYGMARGTQYLERLNSQNLSNVLINCFFKEKFTGNFVKHNTRMIYQKK